LFQVSANNYCIFNVLEEVNPIGRAQMRLEIHLIAKPSVLAQSFVRAMIQVQSG
jgi:hypothetical protein